MMDLHSRPITASHVHELLAAACVSRAPVDLSLPDAKGVARVYAKLILASGFVVEWTSFWRTPPTWGIPATVSIRLPARGLLEFQTTVRGPWLPTAEAEPTQNGVILELPEEAHLTQRRGGFRVTLKPPIKAVIRWDPSGPADAGVAAQVADMSGGGCLLQLSPTLRTGLQVGTRVALEIFLPGEKAALNVAGQVVRYQPGQQGQVRLGMAWMWDLGGSQGRKAQAAIDRFIAAEQLAKRRGERS